MNGNAWRSRYYELNGRIAAEDELIAENENFKSYSYARPAINERAELIKRGGVLEYSHSLNGKARRAVKEAEDDFLVGPMVIPFIWRRWADLSEGKILKISYGVLDQMRSFGFELKREANHPENGSGYIVIKMQASNFFIRLFVDPVYLVFSKEDRSIRKIIGRTLLVSKEGGKLKAIDAELVIENRSRNGYSVQAR